MPLSEAKVFVQAVLTFRNYTTADKEPIAQVSAPSSRLRQDLQPEPETQPTPYPAAEVTGSKSESGIAERQNVDTKADHNAADLGAGVQTNTQSARTDVSGSTVVRRGVLSSGFRLLPMSDDELRRQKSFAGESVLHIGDGALASQRHARSD